MTATLTADPSDLKTRYPLRHFRIAHDLVDNPLLKLERLVELTRELPRDRIEYNSGRLSVNQKAEDTPLVDLSPEEVVRQIETAGAWMVLKRVETVPAYREMMEEALGSMARQLGHKDLDAASFREIEGFIFVSSANSTTPFHCDNEDNLFVQIHGPKFFHLFDNEDRSLVSEELLESAPSKHRNLPYEERFEQRATVYDLKPGEGVFVPYQVPHWVRTGDGYSISMAITWRSDAVVRRNKLIFMNAWLREKGFPQAAPGEKPALDGLKVAAYTAARSAIEPLRKSETMRRLLRRVVFGEKANYYDAAHKAAEEKKAA
ncbi:cupin-like domain-containing protein [Chelatococcus sambhunathii]|uniref:Cupin-like domain-containing protein n=1 Tax=Chelatococcus sambhunathii TaxID=363953 RepID=A0ABU1DFS2_9HYPH|nr:cupin-like domain-containing protein [Chelatococcus sambhunathii]MDR4306755.1 cupin-like domain-containing protein [Chelatococcus sambhunathii]